MITPRNFAGCKCSISYDQSKTWQRGPNRLWAWLNDPAQHARYYSPLCGPVRRVLPSPVRNYCAIDNFERLRDDFGSFGYRDVAFVGENVHFAYSAQMMKPVSTGSV